MRLHVVLASFAAGIGLATPAQADPDPDASFLAALSDAGITYQSGPDAVGIGRRACQLMDQGHSEPDVIKGMTEQNAGFTTDAATKFTQIGEHLLPPAHRGSGITAATTASGASGPALLPVAGATSSVVAGWQPLDGK